MRIIGLAGWSGSGKTTLLAKVIPAHRGAGAHASRPSSTPITPSTSTSRARIRTPIAWPARPRCWSARPAAGRWCTSCAATPSRASTRCCASSSPVDLVLVEGYKREPHPEARGLPRRQSASRCFTPTIRPSSPSPRTRRCRRRALPVVDLDDIEGIADILRARRRCRSMPCSRDVRERLMAQLSDDCFAFSGPLLPVDEVERIIGERVRAGRPRPRRVPLDAACGRVLADRRRRARSSCRRSTIRRSTATPCATPDLAARARDAAGGRRAA